MKDKIQNFIKRSKRRNSHLYVDSVIEGYDYVVCPISNARMSIIKSNYIVNILGMTVEEYQKIYPDIQRICQKHKENISTGLKQLDSTSGLTKYEVGQIKARRVLKTIDYTGMSGYDRKGQKTRNTHMNKIDRHGRNGYSQLASKAIIKGNATKVKKGLILDPICRNKFYRYKTIVTYLTEKYRKSITSGYVTGLAGHSGAFQLDHIYSIMHGFVNKISPIVIGSKENLRMIPWKENLQKHSLSGITIDELFKQTNYIKEKSDLEFEQIILLIHDDIKNNISPTGANLLERLYATFS